jgi:hypothetical protein
MVDRLDYALRLLDLGMVCLPLRKGGKHLDLSAMGYDPVHMRTMRKDIKELAFTGIAFHLAQRPPSRETLVQWFEGFDGNIGILGGYADLLVLDFDHARGFERWRHGNEELVRSTPVAKSPGGFHVYLRAAQPIISSSLHHGLRRVGHAKSLGGYVVASPSKLDGGAAYSWLPGQSPFEQELGRVKDLEAISLLAVSPLRQIYDRMLGRGYFEEH